MTGMTRSARLLPALCCLALATVAQAGVLLQPEPAPEWTVSEWLNGNPGPLSRSRGKVVVIEFFQLWCPGCNHFSIPLFKRWHEQYANRDDVLVVSIHTVFEGHEYQTPERLRQFVREHEILHPVGIDAFERPGDTFPITMEAYETLGTPHVAIVDKEGQLRFSHFGSFDEAAVEAFIERLVKEKPEKAGAGAGRRSRRR
jgi:thiol-disulfide isomerase/thioredoxin